MLSNYLIVHKSILPEYYEKVLACRRLMEAGKVREVSQAVKMVGISRSGKMIIPHGSDVIESNDLVYLIGEKEDIFRLSKQVHFAARRADGTCRPPSLFYGIRPYTTVRGCLPTQNRITTSPRRLMQ